MGRDGQALHLVCEPPGGHESGRCTPPRAARPEADGETGERVGHMPRARGALQPVLRRDHPPGHTQRARARTPPPQSQGRDQDDYCCILDSISVIRYLRYEEATASGAWKSRFRT